MPTEEELKAAAEKAAKEAAEKAEAEKKAAEEKAAKEAQEKEKNFDAWLGKQPADVQALYQEHVGGLKSALDKEREAAKTGKAAQERLAKIEAEAEAKRKAEMTEVERLKSEKDEAEKKARTLELSQLKRDAADATGLPHEFADRLQGETPEALKADAEKLLAAMPKQPEKKQQQKINNNAPGDFTKPVEMTDDQRRDFLYGSHLP